MFTSKTTTNGRFKGRLQTDHAVVNYSVWMVDQIKIMTCDVQTSICDVNHKHLRQINAGAHASLWGSSVTSSVLMRVKTVGFFLFLLLRKIGDIESSLLTAHFTSKRAGFRQLLKCQFDFVWVYCSRSCYFISRMGNNIRMWTMILNP